MNQPAKPSSNLKRISDINVAAFLLAKGHPLVDFQAGPRSEFIFESVPEREVLSYYGDEDQVSARKLLDALKNLKGLIVGVGR